MFVPRLSKTYVILDADTPSSIYLLEANPKEFIETFIPNAKLEITRIRLVDE